MDTYSGDLFERHLLEVEGLEPFLARDGEGGVDLDLRRLLLLLGDGDLGHLVAKQRLRGALLGGIKAGDTVAVLGTGGVSIYALQLAKAMGATVIATSSSDAKLERLRDLGADHVINYRSTPEWGEEMRRLTGGRGVDIVVEVGGPATLAQSIVAGRPGAHIALIGVLTGRSGEIPTALLMARQQRLQGLIVGSRAQQIDFVRALETLKLRPVIDRSFALADLVEAFRYQESGAHFGKICVTM